MSIEVVSWDVDGTLYELPRMIRFVCWLALKRGLFHPLRVAGELRTLSKLRRAMEQVRHAGGDMNALAFPERSVARPFEREWYGEAIRMAGPRQGVVKALAVIRAQGLRLVVLSDFDSEFKLEALGLSGTFERVYSGEALGQLKPSPRLFEHVIRDLGIRPEALLHVGDRPETDAASSAAVGYKAMILSPGPLNPALFHGV